MNFWNWVKDEAGEETILRIDGPIDDEKFWGNEITPLQLREELEKKTGDLTVWVNSPGGNVFAAAQIYNLLKSYKGKITVKIDSLAASAATVVAMAGDEVFMSPVAMFMVHNPMTIAMGNEKDFEETINVLKAVKKSIVNAYVAKTGRSVKTMMALMDGVNGEGTWMDAQEALANGFIDGILFSEKKETSAPIPGQKESEEEEEVEEEGEKEDDKIKAAKAAAKQRYTDYINATMRNARNGITFGNDANATQKINENEKTDPSNILIPSEDNMQDDAPATEPSTEPDPEKQPGRSRQRREKEENADENEETSEEEEKEEKGTPSDKILMNKPAFDENGFTKDGKMSYNILRDKLEALR